LVNRTKAAVPDTPLLGTIDVLDAFEDEYGGVVVDPYLFTEYIECIFCVTSILTILLESAGNTRSQLSSISSR
jgi:hypothetical protein